MLNKAKKVKVDSMLRYFCPKFSLRFFTRSRKKPGSASWFVISTFHAGFTETWVRRKTPPLGNTYQLTYLSSCVFKPISDVHLTNIVYSRQMLWGVGYVRTESDCYLCNSIIYCSKTNLWIELSIWREALPDSTYLSNCKFQSQVVQNKA